MTEMEEAVEGKLHGLQAKVEEATDRSLSNLQLKVGQEVAELERAIGASKALGDETKMRIDKGNQFFCEIREGGCLGVRQTFEGPPSAVSKPIFATEDIVNSIFRD